MEIESSSSEESEDLKAGNGSGSISVMLAQTYDPEKHDPSNWLMSEKLDGVRCYWNGRTGLFTRNGNKFYAPKWWSDGLPKIALDGELWSGRDNFQSIVSIVRKHDTNNEGWKHIKFHIFDAPLIKGNFKKRLARIEKELKGCDSNAKLLEQVVCKSSSHLIELTDQILSKKGEGVMIKDPNSAYERRRSYSLLKVKKFHDAEATVIAHEKGDGRCWGMLGALRVEEKDGTTFKVGGGFTDK